MTWPRLRRRGTVHRRELEAMLRLKGHPYVISVEEILEGPHGPCLVMEFAPGGSLMARVEDGVLSGPELVLVGQQVSEALHAAHALGIVHRDIKPHNLLIGAFGQVKVCDFGIASLVRDGGGATRTGALTMAYASPEELDGDPVIGPPADVYSFGATMLHLATGRRLSFRERMDVDTLRADVDQASLAPVMPLLMQALRHGPADRPTVDALIAGFEAAAQRLGPDRLRSLSSGSPPALQGAAEETVRRQAEATIIRRRDTPAAERSVAPEAPDAALGRPARPDRKPLRGSRGVVAAGIAVLACSLIVWAVMAQSRKDPAVAIVTTTGAPASPSSSSVPATTTIATSSVRPDVVVPDESPTSLVVTTLRAGSGPMAAPGDTLLVNYVLVLSANALEIDNSFDRNEPLQVQLGAGEVIKGVDIGLVSAQAGGRYQLDIPPDLAYGAVGAGAIPANAALTMVVDVVGISAASTTTAGP